MLQCSLVQTTKARRPIVGVSLGACTAVAVLLHIRNKLAGENEEHLQQDIGIIESGRVTRCKSVSLL